MHDKPQMLDGHFEGQTLIPSVLPQDTIIHQRQRCSSTSMGWLGCRAARVPSGGSEGLESDRDSPRDRKR